MEAGDVLAMLAIMLTPLYGFAGWTAMQTWRNRAYMKDLVQELDEVMEEELEHELA